MSTFPPHAAAFIAWAFSDLEKAREILDRHPRLIRSTNSVGETALHYLTVEGRTAAVALLIARGAAIDTRDFSGATPLHHAAQLGHVELVRIFLDREADATARDESGATPLHLACGKNGVAEIVTLLLEAGADVNAFDALDRPLDLAVQAGRADLEALLRAAGAVETKRSWE